MMVRKLVVLSALAGTAIAAHADDTLTWTWSWRLIEANTTNVLTSSPTGMNIIGPGEGAEIRGSFSFTPPVGTIRTNHNNQTGPVAGLANTIIDFHAAPGHGGGFHGPVNRFPAAGPPPTFHDDRIRGIVVGQFSQLLNTSNSFPDAVRIRWTPNDFLDPSPRLVNFWAEKGDLTTTTGATLLIEIGTSPPGQELYVGYFISLVGGSLEIPIIPAPSVGVLLGAAGFLALYRRRRSDAGAAGEPQEHTPC